MRYGLLRRVIGIFFAVCLLCSAGGAAITRKRVAIFAEEGFPSRSPRPVAWYQQTLSGAGLSVTVLKAREFSDPQIFSRRSFDTLIVATGGLLPRDAEYALGLFMRGGGTVLVDGSIAGSMSTAPKEVMAEAERLHKLYGKGEAITAYQDYLFQQAAFPGTLFEYRADLQRWAPASYLGGNGFTPAMCGEFEFESWPNPWQITPDYYGRPFSEDLQLQPTLKGTAFPAVLPRTITLENGQTLTADAQSQRMCRWSLYDHSFGDNRPSSEFSNDIFLTLYQFAAPSGKKYPAFSKAGEDAKDRESDFFIYRCHNALKDNYTLVHFGWAGAHLLRSNQGATSLLAALQLAESPLPGERGTDFIAHCHALESTLEDYYRSSVQAIESLQRLARVAHGRRDETTVTQALERAMAIRMTFEEVSREGERLRRLKLVATAQGDAERVLLTARCRTLLTELQRTCAEVKAKLSNSHPAMHPPVQNPWGRIFLDFDFVEPGGLSRNLELAKIARELGFSGMPLHGSFYADRIFRQTGLSSGYRMDGMEYGHPFGVPYTCGTLNPTTGAVTPVKSSWFDTPESRAKYDEAISWRLKKLQADHPEITRVFCMQERSMDWSMWGERMRGKFLRYLTEQYKTIQRVNMAWGSDYAAWSDIKLPVKRPESPREHALWEDWTRFRELYLINEERLPLIRAIKQAAPRMAIMAYQNYCSQLGHPAHGINYYDYGKVLDWNTLELGSMGYPEEEMAADITGFFHKSITPEWGSTYLCCMPGGEGQKIDMLKRRMWNGLGWGQIGWCTFAGSSANLPYSNFVDADNHVTPPGWMVKELMRDFDAVGYIFLDGQREEPAVRILYSPTTQRHTNWPGLEREKSLEAVCGFQRACEMLKMPSRAIDEGAILDGHLARECKLLILPETTYLNRQLYAKIHDFLKAGGTVLATADAGRFDQYGTRQDALLALAGVAEKSARQPVVTLAGGRQYRAQTINSARPEALVPVFPEQAEIVLRADNGDALVTKTRVGKGQLLISGLPLGRQFLLECEQRPEAALAVMNRLLDAAKLERNYQCDDLQLTIRPWSYHGKHYLAIANPERTGPSQGASSSAVAVARAPLATSFTLTVTGQWSVTDVALGVPVLTTHTGHSTLIHGLVDNPGGVVYALAPASNVSMTPGKPAPVKPASTGAGSFPATLATLPFQGRLAFETGARRIGDYLLTLDVETKGQLWGGDLYLTVEHKGEKLRKLCRDGDVLLFPLLSAILAVECRQVSAVMPIGMLCVISEKPREPRVRGCRMREERFNGQRSIVLENEYLHARILPALGGRLIEFAFADDGINQLLANPQSFNSGATDGGWVDYGGIEENLGQYPGQIWNAAYQVQLTRNDAEEVVLTLQCPGIRLDAQQQVGLEKIYSLRAGESQLHVRQHISNEGTAVQRLRLWIHPEILPGGEVSPTDSCYFDTPDAPLVAPFQPGYSASYQNLGCWSAIIDQEKRQGIIESYPRETVNMLYFLMQNYAFNLEFGTAWRDLPPRQSLEIAYALGLLRGLGGLRGCHDGLALNLALRGQRVVAQRQNVEINLEGAALAAADVTVDVTIEKDGLRVAALDAVKWRLTPEAPAQSMLRWATGEAPDGAYTITATARDAVGNARLTVHAPFTIAGAQLTALLNSAQAYRKRLEQLKQTPPAPARESWRARMVRATGILYTLDDALANNKLAEAQPLIAELDALLKGGNR